MPKSARPPSAKVRACHCGSPRQPRHACAPRTATQPPDAIGVLNKAVTAALADPKMQVRIAELGGTPMPMSPAEFGKLVADETEKWGVVVKSAGISVE